MQEIALETRQLGQTGLEITRVGFGAWAIVGFRSATQVDPIVPAANLVLSDEDAREITETLAATDTR